MSEPATFLNVRMMLRDGRYYSKEGADEELRALLAIADRLQEGPAPSPDCPGHHGDQCCGYPELCREAMKA